MNSHIKNRLLALAMSAIVLVAAAGCDLNTPTPTPVANPTGTATSPQPTATVGTTGGATAEPTPESTPQGTPAAGVTPSVRHAVRFAHYNLQPSNVTPAVAPYTVAPDLSNVSVAEAFGLSDEMKGLIAKYGFAAQFPKEFSHKQFYQLYEDGRYDTESVFVTTDSVLHVYHLIFDKILRSTETKYLISDLEDLTAGLLKASQDQYDQLKGTEGEQAARRNVAYFTVASRLLDANAPVPDYVRTEVAQELQQIDRHEGLTPSAVMAIGNPEMFVEDYGQYKPRGHYTRSEDLSRYFRAMMWYGRITFRLKLVEETRSALLLTRALQTAQAGDTTAEAAWARIYEPTAFFVGGADDLTFRDYAPVIEQAIGANASLEDLVSTANVEKFQEAAKSLAGPRINSMFVYVTEDKETVTKGLRMMGQRFTLDAYVFGQLIWRNVGSQENPRTLPKALDVPAAFGSEEAYEILEDMGETKYEKFDRQLSRVRGEIASLDTSQWTENLYWSWLYTFRPLLEPKSPDSGYPSFMTNEAWTRKNLNTVLGSYTELKHDTILYAKQVMAEAGGGPPEIVKGYVEPEPEFYARIAALSAMTRDGLLSRGLLEKTEDRSAISDFNTLNQIESLALDLKRISEKELENKALTQEEYELIRFYGARIEHLTIAAADQEEGQGGPSLQDQDAAVVADIATGGPQLDQALEEATGRIMEIYVVVPIAGNLVLARGGIYSQYEFVQPSSNRLTNEQWRQRLDNGQVPEEADWKVFIGK
ncbi:MAG TPA: DUF3160 domain-containing protein [Chloroflexia bacterium]|nr:DUF3160 domain-containing protein [Chloroflexia bacterium]